MDSARYTLRHWHDGQATLTAWGSDRVSALAAGLSGLLAAARTQTVASEEDATTALAIRAEGSDLAALFTGLASALLDEIDHEDYDVRAVQCDGLVRTDNGLAGWGYAFAVPGAGRVTSLRIEDVTATDEGGMVILRALVHRLPETGTPTSE